MNLREDYSDYESYMNNFYKLYNDDVGFEVLKNNVRTDKQNLMINKLSNINDFGITIDKIYKMIDGEQKSQGFLSCLKTSRGYTAYTIGLYRTCAYGQNVIILQPYVKWGKIKHSIIL